jgi:hypothetical protein
MKAVQTKESWEQDLSYPILHPIASKEVKKCKRFSPPLCKQQTWGL